MTLNSRRVASIAWESLLLILLLGAVGVVLAPAHWTSIWMDREFTGWVAPIANDMANGLVLYADGGHSPMPPLPYIIMELLTHGNATWFDESVLILVSQSLIILIAYATFRIMVSGPGPLLIAMALTPLIFSLPKTIFYDAWAQLLVACLVLFNVLLVYFAKIPAGRTAAWRCVVMDLALAALTALLFLSKQSTAVGAFAGTAACLLAFNAPHPAPDSRRRWLLQRVLRIARYVAGTAVLLFLFALALSPWMSVSGFFRDVFLNSSEAKGGTWQLLSNLLIYGREFATHALTLLLIFSAFLLLGDFMPALEPRKLAARFHPGATSAIQPLWVSTAWAGLCAGAAVLVLGKRIAPECLAADYILWPGFLVGLLFVLTRLYSFARVGASSDSADASLGYVAAMLVSLPAAITHSLSVPSFRWTYDNNFLLALAVAGPLLGLLAWSADDSPNDDAGNRRLASPGRLAFVVGMVFLLQVSCWSKFVPQFVAARSCTVSWDESAYLNSARLPLSADALRQCLAAVRRLAPDAAKDEVLLLPNDPDVAARIGRPAPRLSSAIVFFDQYINQYVDEDFARLAKAPPKVIIIGPENFMLSFANNVFVDNATMRLIDRVRSRLLPADYLHVDSASISFQGGFDTLEIYVRKDTPATSAP